MNAKIRGRRRNSVVAGIGAIVLLLGGTTFALWSASDSKSTGNITTGNLDLFVGDLNWYDISFDRTDRTTTTLTGHSAHAIETMSDYRIVPGDEVIGEALLGVALEGDNMVAELKLEFDDDDLTGLQSLLEEGYLYINWMVYQVTDNQVDWDHLIFEKELYPNSEEYPTTLNDALKADVLFQASGSGQANGSPDSVGSSTLPTVSYTALPTNATGGVIETELNYIVVIDAKFHFAAFSTISTRAEAILGDLTVSLTQTRNPSAGNFTSPAAG